MANWSNSGKKTQEGSDENSSLLTSLSFSLGSFGILSDSSNGIMLWDGAVSIRQRPTI